MKFKHVVEQLNKNGSKERSQRDYEKSEIVIGRGGVSDIIFQSRLLSLTHAKIVITPERVTIEDLGSVGGVSVNGKLIKLNELRAGDRIKLGDIELLVTKDEEGWGILQTIAVREGIKTEDIVRRNKEALDLKNHLPSFKLLSLALSLTVALVFLIVPFFSTDPKRPDKLVWNSGPISNGHKMIERDCQRCHAVPFQRVQDTACESCHKMTDHAPSLPGLLKAEKDSGAPHHPRVERRCAECHMEHNGDVGKHPMTATEAELCSTCHTSITAIDPKSQRPNVPAWGTHPEFSVSLKKKPEDKEFVRVRLDDKQNLVDTTPIKLNHELHLKPNIRGANGPETLQCRSCHELAEDFKTTKPIKMERHCLSCHPLGFDQRLPSKQVPHGDDNEIYPYLYTEYTMLLLAGAEDPNEPEVDPATLRQKPGGTGLPAPKREVINTTTVHDNARSAETQLFTKTACVLCHETSLKPQSERTDTNGHYNVLKPNVPQRWMTASIFGHGAHEEVTCESCHGDARKSTKTTDVLLPGVDSCRECHADHGGKGKVGSDCVLCHSYHDPEQLPVGAKDTIQNLVAFVR